MSRFRDILRGLDARKRVEVPYGAAAIVCWMRPLTGDQESAAHADGLRHAKEKGVEAPAPGDIAYELGRRAGIVARSAMAAETGDEPYFESVAEVLSGLDPDRILILYEEQERWQEHASPRASAMDEPAFNQGVVECAGGVDQADRFLSRCRPGLRASFLHTLAGLHFSALLDKSASGSTATASG